MEKSSFFNSVNHDRKYAAADWAAYFSSFIGNGVFAKPSNSLQIIESTGMKITVKVGSAFINGYYYRLTADINKSLVIADGINDRIDRAIIRWSLLARKISFEILTGTPSGAPVAPAITRNSEIWELALADIRVRAGVTSITQSDITDCRPASSLCGFVTGVVEQFDFETLCSQFDSFFSSYEAKIVSRYNEYDAGIDNYEVTAKEEFEAWFRTVKNTLDGDTAGNLLNAINAIDTKIDKASEEIQLKGFSTYKHVRSSDNVHYLECIEGGNNIKFIATAPYVKGDTFSINGTPVSLRVSQGKNIGSNLFRTGSVVIGFRNGNILCLVGSGDVEEENIANGAVTEEKLNAQVKKIFAPSYASSASDPGAGSALATGKLYIVYE